MDQSNIIKPENMKLLELKIDQIRNTYTEKTEQEDKIIEALVAMLISHGKDKNQIHQIAQISRILGEALCLGNRYCNRLEYAARIYDIGNIIIDKEIYRKDEKLSFEEFEIVKHHTRAGYDILITQNFVTADLSAIISAEHHEWWDGGGYPRRRKKTEINIASRIVAIADTIAALYNRRPGRAVWSYPMILEYIKLRSGTQFDPEIVKAFLNNRKRIEEVLSTNKK
jgi:putative two-component system response regulator/two-component system response regulator RpfG